jgi:hypothetical protein
MDFDAYFMLVFIVIAAYVIVGNYLYLGRVIRALNKAPEFFPTTQFRDMDAYLRLLLAKGERPWFLFYLKNVRAIALVIVILMVPVFLDIVDRI